MHPVTETPKINGKSNFLIEIADNSDQTICGVEPISECSEKEIKWKGLLYEHRPLKYFFNWGF